MNFSDIKVIAIDCDGVLTDGIYQISEQEVAGRIVTKSFYTRDFSALEQLMKADIFVFIVTQSHDKVMYRQLQRIASHSKFWMDQWCTNKLRLFSGIENKEETIIEEVRKLPMCFWDWDNVAYIGDAENDISSMKKALYTGCPCDAIEAVKEEANYISDFPGGKGAVYDFCMHILEKKFMESKE